MVSRFSTLIFLSLSLFCQVTPKWIAPPSYTVATTPLPGVRNRVIFVTDAASVASCTVGGGSTVVFCRDTGLAWEPAGDGSSGGGGSGTVTDVSVVSANGVSGSVANSTTTPAITLSLGAITPSSVAAVGTVTGSNLSGTNTGDQTNISGNAGTASALQTARSIYGNNFDGTADLNQVISSTYGGTGATTAATARTNLGIGTGGVVSCGNVNFSASTLAYCANFATFGSTEAARQEIIFVNGTLATVYIVTGTAAPAADLTCNVRINGSTVASATIPFTGYVGPKLTTITVNSAVTAGNRLAVSCLPGGGSQTSWIGWSFWITY